MARTTIARALRARGRQAARAAQLREIDEIKKLIADLERNPPPEGARDIPSYRDKGMTAPKQK